MADTVADTATKAASGVFNRVSGFLKSKAGLTCIAIFAVAALGVAAIPAAPGALSPLAQTAAALKADTAVDALAGTAQLAGTTLVSGAVPLAGKIASGVVSTGQNILSAVLGQ